MSDGEEEILIGKESLRKSTLTKLFWLGFGCLGVLFVCGGMVNVWSTGQVQPTASPVVYVTEQEVTREVVFTQQMVVDVTATPTPTPDLPITATPTPTPKLSITATPTPTPELSITATPTFTSLNQESLIAYYPFRTDAADATGQHPAAELENVLFAPPEENFMDYLDLSSTITLSHPLTSEQFTFAIHLVTITNLTFPDTPPQKVLHLLGTQPTCDFVSDGFRLIYSLRLPFPQLVLENGSEQLFVQWDLLSQDPSEMRHLHLAAVFSDTQFKLYLNGQLMGVKDGRYTPVPAPFVIRPRLCQPSLQAEEFGMAVNNLLFYNYPLSDSEVAELYQTYLSSLP